MLTRLPRGAVEALLLLLQRSRVRNAKKRYATATDLKTAADVDWETEWPLLRDWVLSRGLARVVREVKRGEKVTEVRYGITERGCEVAAAFEEGVNRAYPSLAVPREAPE